MDLRYVDVFISHKQEDAKKAQDLKLRIEKLGLTCWIDDDDEEMRRLQEARPVNYRALTDRVREHLRTCRCLIFAFSAKSHASRWMPWELGFFDGRWGQRLIGLYDLDQDAEENPTQPEEHKDCQGSIGIPEFLQIYTELKPETLESFLQYARSPRGLADRADVDIDRWANLLAGMMRDPVNVSIDAWQFWISYQQAFWSRALGTSAPDVIRPWLGFTEAVRSALTPLAAMMRPASPGTSDQLAQVPVAPFPDALKNSEDARIAPPFAGMEWPGPIGAVDRLVQTHHDASADAVQVSRAP